MNDQRADIQGLRGIAVLSVVLFHFLPRWVPGGYVGVDVFFVISGFLITQLLLREARDKGRPFLLAFASRRILRLLPASTTRTRLRGPLSFSLPSIELETSCSASTRSSPVHHQ